MTAALLTGCGVDGSILGRTAAPSASKLLVASRSGFASQGSIRVTEQERTRDGQHSTIVTSLQYQGIDIVSHESDGVDADLRVLAGSAWARGNPLYWVSSQGLESSQIPLVTRGWDAMQPTALHLPHWFVQALSDPTLLEDCEVPSIPGGVLSITGHETFDGHTSTVLSDRAAHGGKSERIVIESGSPYLPEQISFSGGLAADSGCGVSATASRAVRSATRTFDEANSVHIARPHATLDEERYDAVVAAPSTAGARIPASLAHRVAGRHTLSGRVAATLGVRGDHVGERMSIPWTLTPHCAGGSCRLTLSVDDGPAVPVRTGRFGLFARPSFENRCTGPTGRRLIPTEIGLTDRGGRIRAWSSEATTACGGPSADYLVWQGS
ncbi:MAG TPA: hypothetical protein VGL69_13385 [Solirubrobacteraceae bacterium]|jgi:hypothetical protein